MIDEEAFAELFPKARAGTWDALVSVAIPRADLSTARRLCYFLAQCGHESQGFSRLEENLHYASADRIRAVWPSRFPTRVSAMPYVADPRALANKVYSGRMGNGDEASGDGWRYRGRGWLQVTGKANYREMAQWFGQPDLDPDSLSNPTGAALSAAWFWTAYRLNGPCDEGDFSGLTRRINGGLTGLKERLALLDRVSATTAFVFKPSLEK